jgi:hypothetical protein
MGLRAAQNSCVRGMQRGSKEANLCRELILLLMCSISAVSTL